MLFKPNYDENGKKVLCEMNGINSDMLMDIYVKKLNEGEVLDILEEDNECAVLLLSGKVNFTVADSINEDCERKNPFEKTPYAVHFCRGTKAVITALCDSEILVQMTDNEKTWVPVFYNPDNCLYQEFGKGQWNGTGHRIVSTMFDRIQIWLWVRYSISRVAGQATLRITIRSLNCITISLTILKASEQALRVTHLTKPKTAPAFAYAAVMPTSRLLLRAMKCITYGLSVILTVTHGIKQEFMFRNMNGSQMPINYTF